MSTNLCFQDYGNILNFNIYRIYKRWGWWKEIASLKVFSVTESLRTLHTHRILAAIKYTELFLPWCSNPNSEDRIIPYWNLWNCDQKQKKNPPSKLLISYTLLCNEKSYNVISTNTEKVCLSELICWLKVTPRYTRS